MSREYYTPPNYGPGYTARPADQMPNVEKFGYRELHLQQSPRPVSSRHSSDTYPFRSSLERATWRRNSTTLTSLPVFKRAAQQVISAPKTHVLDEAQREGSHGGKRSKLNTKSSESVSGNAKECIPDCGEAGSLTVLCKQNASTRILANVTKAHTEHDMADILNSHEQPVLQNSQEIKPVMDVNIRGECEPMEQVELWNSWNSASVPMQLANDAPNVLMSSTEEDAEETAPEILNKVYPLPTNQPEKAPCTAHLTNTLPEVSQLNFEDLEVTVKHEPMEHGVAAFDTKVTYPCSSGAATEEAALGILDIGDTLLVNGLENGSDPLLPPNSTTPEAGWDEALGVTATSEPATNDVIELIVNVAQVDSSYVKHSAEESSVTIQPLIATSSSRNNRRRRFGPFNGAHYIPRPYGKWKNWSDERKINAVRWFGAYPEDLTQEALDKCEIPEPNFWPVFVDGGWKIPDAESCLIADEDNQFAEIFGWNVIGSETVPGGSGLQSQAFDESEAPAPVDVPNCPVQTRWTDGEKLQAWCGHLGLPTFGKKSDLIGRLYTHYCTTPVAGTQSRPKKAKKKKLGLTFMSPSTGDLETIVRIRKEKKTRIKWLKTHHFKRVKDVMEFSNGVPAFLKKMDLIDLLRIQQILKSKIPQGCPECGKHFPAPSVLIDHFQFRHTDKQVFPCQQCGYSCYNDKILRKHVRTKHPLPFIAEIVTARGY